MTKLSPDYIAGYMKAIADIDMMIKGSQDKLIKRTPGLFGRALQDQAIDTLGIVRQGVAMFGKFMKEAFDRAR